MPPEHDDAAHEVPAGRSPHAPLTPLHIPVVHPASAHSPAGSVPAATGAQAPSLWPVCAATQLSHIPVQAELQQTPSLHVAERHVVPVAHGTPRPCLAVQMLVDPSQKSVTPQLASEQGPQTPPSQLRDRQSVLAPQLDPSAHAGQLGPPQSVSVSVPF